MASNIEFETIDPGFPKAGVDNNTQGFRDNFNIIKTSLGDARSEITNLQDNSARKDEDNDFANNSLVRVNLDTMTLTYIDGGTVLGATEVNISNGHYHLYEVDSSMTFTLAGWPNQNVASVVVELIGANSGPYTVSFIGEGSATFMSPGSGFNKTGNSPSDSGPGKLNIELSSDTNSKIIEFWSYDNGTTVYAKYLGRYNDNVSATNDITGNTTIEGDLEVTGNITVSSLAVADVDDISNVNSANPNDRDLLIFDSNSSTWEAAQLDTLTATLTGDVKASDGAVLIDHINKTLTGDVTGDVTGSLTGEVVGEVTGDLTGNVIGDVTGSVTGNVTGNVIGDLTGNVIADDATVLVDNTSKVIDGIFIGTVQSNVTGNITGNVIATDSTVLVNANTKELSGVFVGTVLADVTGDLTGNVTGDLTGDVFAVDNSVLVNYTTKEIDGTFVGEVTGDVTGDVNGNVVANDSTVLVNATTKEINGTFVGEISGSTGDISGDVLAGDGTVLVNAATKEIDGTFIGTISGGGSTDIVTPSDTLAFPSYTTAGRDSKYGVSAAAGTVIFNTSNFEFQGWDGAAWVVLGT